MKVIETTGRFEKSGILKIDCQIQLKKRKNVKVIILYDENDDINEGVWLQTISNNPTFTFLNDKKEDIYSLNDGKPIKK